MARNIFGGEFTHVSVAEDTTNIGTTAGGSKPALVLDKSVAVQFLASRGGAVVTDYMLKDGTGNFTVPSTTVTTDANGLLPEFQGPDGTTALYTSLGSVLLARESGYTKPTTGIPETDLATAVQTKLNDAVPDTLVDAKGDLIVATGADTVARRAVGANGTVLTADSLDPSGVKWATVSATGAAPALDDVLDVEIINRVHGDVLTYNDDGVKWVNAQPQVAPLPAYLLTGKILNTGDPVPADMPAGSLILFRATATAMGATAIGQNGSSATTTAATGLGVTTTAAVAAGENVVLSVVVNGSVDPAFTVTDSGGNTYSTSVAFASGTYSKVALIQARVTTALASGAVITVKPSVDVTHIAVVAARVTGLRATLPLDKQATGGGGNITSLSVGPATPAQANELAVASFGWNSDLTTFTAGTGWTQVGTTQSSGGGSPRSASLFVRVLPDTTATTFTGTFSQARAVSAVLGLYYGA